MFFAFFLLCNKIVCVLFFTETNDKKLKKKIKRQLLFVWVLKIGRKASFWWIFLSVLRWVQTDFIFTCSVRIYCVYPAMSTRPTQMQNCLNTIFILIVYKAVLYHVLAFRVLLPCHSIYTNQVLEKLYFDHWQYPVNPIYCSNRTTVMIKIIHHDLQEYFWNQWSKTSIP